MSELAHPIELLNLDHDHSVVFRVKRWLAGTTIIKPASSPTPIEKAVLRVWIDRLDKPSRAVYWDITPQAIQTAMLPFLRLSNFVALTFTIRAFAYGPRKNFTIEVA